MKVDPQIERVAKVLSSLSEYPLATQACTLHQALALILARQGKSIEEICSTISGGNELAAIWAVVRERLGQLEADETPRHH